MRSIQVWWITLVAIGLACQSNEPLPPQGFERGDCYPNGTCNAGLTCLSFVCVNAGAQDAASTAPAVGGGLDTGAGGTFGSPDGGVDATINGTGGTAGAAGMGAAGSGGVATGGTGGNPASGGQGGGGPGKQVPDGVGLAEWKSFLEAGEYKKQGWVAETALPRAKKSISPHGRVRIHFNEKLRQAHSFFPAMYAAGSLTIAEFFDANDMLQGWAGLLKLVDGDDGVSWEIVCIGPDTSCLQGTSTANRSEIAGSINQQHRLECYNCHHPGAKPTTKLIYTVAP